MPKNIVVSEGELAEADRYALENYTQNEIKNFSSNSRIVIAKNKEQVRNFIENAKTSNCNKGNKLLLGKIKSYLAQRIYNETNINLSGYNLELRADEIRHLFKQHGNENTEAPRGQRAVTIDDVFNFVDIIQNFDKVKNNMDNSLTFVKNANGVINAVTLHTAGNKSLSLKTMWVNRKGGLSQATNVKIKP